MTKIMVSLRSVFIMDDRCLAYGNPEIRKMKYYPTLRFYLLKSTEYLNFRHFRHFAILGISLGNLIVSQKDLAT
jgi:hypothetical protein